MRFPARGAGAWGRSAAKPPVVAFRGSRWSTPATLLDPCDFSDDSLYSKRKGFFTPLRSGAQNSMRMQPQSRTTFGNANFLNPIASKDLRERLRYDTRISPIGTGCA